VPQADRPLVETIDLACAWFCRSHPSADHLLRKSAVQRFLPAHLDFSLMAVCARCGHENRAEARFCDSCGSPLEVVAPERRKLATMLFCDLSGSTAMGERVDAESVRELMFSYFHEMRGAIERHGGTVEKFIGDAVMAVFGVPTAHEDDALRAVRAAWEMQERLTALNEELERRFGSTIALRIGLSTGEVVAGEASARQALVTGDAVNVAARLEQAASPGEILIGDPTYRLVRDAVSVEPVSPLTLKGKSEPLPAYRLIHVEAAAPARTRRLDTPMVGRHNELALLRQALAEAAGGHPALVTVVGEPGVGKSRLASELMACAEGFQILSGRCLEYGEGITYWPIAEIVRQAAGIRDEHSREEARARIGSLLPDEGAAVVAQAIGVAEGEAGITEIAAAIAGLLESLAQDAPLLVLVDDIHWGEEALLELLASVPGQIAGARVLVLGLARPELVEERSWDATVRLQPLEESDSTTLVGQLLGEADLPEGLAARIAGAAAGNPLFVEELVGMLIDERLLERQNGRWAAASGLAEFTVPPTLRELLGARLDRMPAGERSALERGAIEGQVFHRGAVSALSATSEVALLPERLNALAEKEFVRPAPAEFVDDAAYRFRHILIRDAAYDALPKRTRADLHERYADWLEERAGGRVAEYDEILGFHLERAYRLLEELGPVSEDARRLASRGAEHLGSAAQRARARRDAGAAIGLLLRTAGLRPPRDATRLELLESAGHLLFDAGDLPGGMSIFEEAFAEARAADNRPLAARLEMFVAWGRLLLDPGHGVAPILALGERLEPALREAGDDLSLARLHDMRAYCFDLLRQSAEVEREAEIAIGYARRAGNRWHELELHWWLLWQLPQGPRPVEDALARSREMYADVAGDGAAEAAYLESLGLLEAMRGRFEEARTAGDRSIGIREELGLHLLLAKLLPWRGITELLAGDPQAAASVFRRAYEAAEGGGDVESASNAASWLIEALLAQDRHVDAEVLVPAAERAEAGDAVGPQVRSRCARAKVLSRKGAATEAGALTRSAVDLARGTDDLGLQGMSLDALAEVLAAGGRYADARTAAEAALEAYERKGNTVSAEAARRFLDQLDR
jgi:class 3 adenylate cyclase